MSRSQADEYLKEQTRLKRDLHVIEQDIRAADDQSRFIDKAIITCEADIRKMAAEVNENLVNLKLQRSDKITEMEDGRKYYQGVHIVMSSENGTFN